MTDYNNSFYTEPPDYDPPSRMTAGQWFILVLLVLLNAAVLGVLVLAVTGRLTL
ncbi:MAG: hypothetical protein R3C44_11855 [Chloroflexota bacterium]